jgi:valyl-tRNA synthetase
MKVLNASRFVLSHPEPRGEIESPVDRGMLTELARLVESATTHFEEYDYAAALERTERWFWFLCDDYLELVKSRRYGAMGDQAAGSANTALVTALSTILRLFAPFLPFVTEEVWSWWREGSIHRATWPTAAEVLGPVGGSADEAGVLALQRASLVLGEVRRTKSEAKRPLSTPVAHVRVQDTAEHLVALRTAEVDVRSAGVIQELELAEGDVFEVAVTLAAPQAVSPQP